MKSLFHTIITSERHRTIGYCEPSDFGRIELIELEESEKELIVSFSDYKEKKEFIEFDGYAFVKCTDKNLWGFSQEITENWMKKQGKFSQAAAIKLMLDLRARCDNSFSCVHSETFILIGRTLYSRYSKIEDLAITVCGNMSFAHWISINIEAHGGKTNHVLNKTNFNEIVKKEFSDWKKGNPKTTNIVGQSHSCFSKPKSVKWGAKYNV